MTHRYQKTTYWTSAYEFRQLPPDRGREVAFAGRSNAGKSSALNALTQQKALARISKTPGRTQMINFFQVEPERCLVDLPGYGYAKVPITVRRHWQQVVSRYVGERHALQGLFLLMDIRHPLTDLDQRLLAWCARRELPVHVLLTKADKLKTGAALNTLRQVARALESAYPRTSVQLFSALKRLGMADAQRYLDAWLGYADPPAPGG
jgi:GTP-binding protein